MAILERYYKTKFVVVTATAVFAALGTPAIAATPAEDIKSRQQKLKDLGAAMKLINDQLKTDAPDVARIREAAAKVKKHSEAIGTWFPSGTGPEAGVETAAKPEIWTDAADFAEKVQGFQAEAGKLATIAAASDLASMKKQVRMVARTCGGCHDTYRVKKGT